MTVIKPTKSKRARKADSKAGKSHQPCLGLFRHIYGKVCKKDGRVFAIEYYPLKRRWSVFNKDGNEIAAFKHSDLALMFILRQFTPWQGDECPPQYRHIMSKIEQLTGLKYQGLNHAADC